MVYEQENPRSSRPPRPALCYFRNRLDFPEFSMNGWTNVNSELSNIYTPGGYAGLPLNNDKMLTNVPQFDCKTQTSTNTKTYKLLLFINNHCLFSFYEKTWLLEYRTINTNCLSTRLRTMGLTVGLLLNCFKLIMVSSVFIL